jgi:hypothetical protein
LTRSTSCYFRHKLLFQHLWQFHRQFLFWNSMWLRIVDDEIGAFPRVSVGLDREVDWDGLAPVALTREDPVTQLVSDLYLRDGGVR